MLGEGVILEKNQEKTNTSCDSELAAKNKSVNPCTCVVPEK
jgi:hypothetical protein